MSFFCRSSYECVIFNHQTGSCHLSCARGILLRPLNVNLAKTDKAIDSVIRFDEV